MSLLDRFTRMFKLEKYVLKCRFPPSVVLALFADVSYGDTLKSPRG